MMSKPNENKKMMIGAGIIGALSVIFIFLALNKPVGDFGNYYYGSRLFADGKKIDSLYKDIHWFNEQVKTYGEKKYFENYIPVPPANLLLYAPFTFFESHTAKLIFNLSGLIILLISLSRYLKLKPGRLGPYGAIGLTAMFVPLYYNFLQGQSYLLVSALILEVYISYAKEKKYRAAFFIAVLFHLKLFPAFVLVYFFFKREYKIAALSVLMMFILGLIASIIIGEGLVINYFTEIVPRLFRNEIIDPFYSGHQSINIFLSNLFRLDEIANPSPLADLPFIAVLLESFFTSVIVYLAYYIVKTRESLFAYSIFIFLGLLLNKYIANYALVILLPFMMIIPKFKNAKIALLTAGLAVILPIGYFADYPVPLKFIRIILMLSLFVLILLEIKPKIDYKIYSVILILLLGVNFISSKKYPNNYFLNSREKGILYNIEIRRDSLLLSRCLGDTSFVKALPLNFRVKSVKRVNEKNMAKYYIGPKYENISKIYLLNDSLLVYLSDLQQGVGMNKVRAVKLESVMD